jgi:ABC-type glycerol-3-phosphate transport system substrate-binding protein
VIGLGGRVAALARSAANKNAAASLLVWLTGPQASAQVAPASSYSAPFRNTHREVAGRWVGPVLSRDAATQYYDVLAKLHGRGPALAYPRLPGWPALHQAVNQAVLDVLAEKQTAAQALQQAAAVWDEHLKTLSKDDLRQLRTLLRQSLP